jgi:LPXTG-motif cell wall-anchored protein
MGGLIVGVLVWQAGGESVAALLALGVAAMAGLAYWLVRRKREGKPTLLDPALFTSKLFSVGVFQIFLQQVALGGMLIALPIYLQLVWDYNALQAGVTLAPLSLTMFGVALLAGRRAGGRIEAHHLLGVRQGGAPFDPANVALLCRLHHEDVAWADRSRSDNPFFDRHDETTPSREKAGNARPEE